MARQAKLHVMGLGSKLFKGVRFDSLEDVKKPPVNTLDAHRHSWRLRKAIFAIEAQQAPTIDVAYH